MRKLAVLTTLFAATLLSAQDASKEMAKLNGTWAVASAESGGKMIAADEYKDFKITIADGAFTARRGTDERKGSLKIDATKKPLTMDISLDATAGNNKTQLAIYDVQTTTLTICLGDIEKRDRPVDFVTKDKPGVTLLTFKKDK